MQIRDFVKTDLCIRAGILGASEEQMCAQAQLMDVINSFHQMFVGKYLESTDVYFDKTQSEH